MIFCILQIHYRVHSLMLKRLGRESPPPTEAELGIMLQYASVFREHGIARNVYERENAKRGWCARVMTGLTSRRFAASTSATTTVTMATLVASASSTTEAIERDLGDGSDVARVAARRAKLVSHCTDAMKLCIRRYVNYYKPYYRLAWAYCNVEVRSPVRPITVEQELTDFAKAEDVLLGNGLSSGLTIGLFTKRKVTIDVLDVSSPAIARVEP